MRSSPRRSPSSLSANCILYVGAKPVFVDIDPQTLNIDVDKVAGAITPKTKAIVAVEAFGHPGGMVELEQLAQQHELMLIEDSCEGFGGHARHAADRLLRPRERLRLLSQQANHHRRRRDDRHRRRRLRRHLPLAAQPGPRRHELAGASAAGLQLSPQRNQRRAGLRAMRSPRRNPRQPPTRRPRLHRAG